MSDKATIKIPRQLYQNLSSIIENTGFNSVTEFIVYVMRDLVSTTDLGENHEQEAPSQEQLTGEEIEMIRKRLRSLGYLD
ncbi:MAG: CopG family transcriptional regulator [Bacillota bacterium]